MTEDSPVVAVLRDAMAERGISGLQLAKRAGVPQSSVSNVLAGKQRVSVRFAMRVAPVLGISVHEIITAQNEADIVAYYEEEDRKRGITDDNA